MMSAVMWENIRGSDVSEVLDPAPGRISSPSTITEIIKSKLTQRIVELFGEHGA
jgi:hypothetical protein